VFGRTEFEKTRADASVLLNAATGEDYSFFAGRGGSDARSERNRIRHSSLRMSSDVTVGQQHALTIGAEVAQLDASYTALVEKPVAGSTTRSALVSSGDQDGSGRLVRVFVEDLWRPIPRLVLTLGTRLVSFDLDSGLRVEPVASAAYAWRPGVQFLGGWSVTHQAAMRVTRENRLKGDTDFWALANGASIPMARTEQWSAGARVDRTGVLLEASLYYKRLEDLTMFATAHASPVAAVLPEPTLHNGSGRAAGVNLLLQSQTSRNDLWVGYSGGRTVYTYPTLGAGTFLASFVRQHEFKIGDTLRVKGPWSVGATWVAASGLPTTSVSREAVWLATAERTYRTIFGSKNASVLPTYRRLDLSSEIVLRVGATNATFGATVFNVFNLQNPRYRTHEIFGATRETSDMLFVGRAFNAFARFGF
jgi:hypothetical protein